MKTQKELETALDEIQNNDETMKQLEEERKQLDGKYYVCDGKVVEKIIHLMGDSI